MSFHDILLRPGWANTIIVEQSLEQAGKDILDPDTYRELDKKLVKAKFILYKKYPFFGLLLTKLKTVITRDIPTMAVDRIGNIYINPEFVLNDLDQDEVTGVLAHETFHIANLTFFRQRGRIHKLWNIATDYIMNRDLLESGLKLPKMGCLPVGSPGNWNVHIEQTGIPPFDIDVTDLTAEKLYDALLQHLNQASQDQPSGSQKSGDSSQDQDTGSQGSGQSDDADESDQDSQGASRSVQDMIDELSEKQEQLDQHIEQGEPSPEAMQVPDDNPVYAPEQDRGQKDAEVQGDLKTKIMSAAQGARSAEGGGMPRGVNLDNLQSTTDWKRVLKDFVMGVSKSQYDWGRPHKRALASGYYAPRSRVTRDKVNAVVAIDTSGSITEPVLRTFLGEIQGILKTYNKAELKIMLWHTNVYQVIDLQGYKDIYKFRDLRVQSGGTNLSSVKEYLDKNDIKDVQALLVLTDGEVESNPKLPIMKKSPIFLIPAGIGTDQIVKGYGTTYFVDIPHS